MPLQSLFQPAYHGVPRQHKTEPRARLCYSLDFRNNHGHDCYKLLDAETGKVEVARDVMGHHSEVPLMLPTTAVGNPSFLSPEDFYVLMSKPVPIIAALAPAPAPSPVPAPAPTSASTTPPPPSRSQHPASTPPHFGCSLQHKRYEETPGWTRGQTRAMREASREYAQHHGLLPTMDHAALVFFLANRESIDEAIRNHSPSKDSRTCHPDLRQTFTLRQAFEVKASPHADIWRQSMNWEFHGLLHVGIFAPV